jgi:hypothetical protein
VALDLVGEKQGTSRVPRRLWIVAAGTAKASLLSTGVPNAQPILVSRRPFRSIC